LNWHSQLPLLDPAFVCNNRIDANLIFPGGLSFSARKRGWACDNVLGYEVVLGNGSIVSATATSNPDLWLALKGGSNNFGIVTRFDLKTFAQKGILGGVVGFNYSKTVLDAQAQAFSSFMQPKNFDPEAMMGVLITNVNGVSAVANSLFYLAPGVNPPAIYKPFLSIPGQVSNNLVVADTATIVNNFGAFTPPQLAR
jgi:hypothetical protein